MADVFISYSGNDREIAQVLASKLEAKNISVWWDFRLAGGQQFRKIIQQELRAALAVVVIWTKNSVESEFVLDEADEARKADKLVSTMFGELSIANLPLGFRNRHAIPLTEFEQVFHAVSRIVGGDTEDAYWASMLSSDDYLEYLAKYPFGRHARVAQQLIGQEDALWEHVSDLGNWELYLEIFPNGRYRNNAYMNIHYDEYEDDYYDDPERRYDPSKEY